ncbi:MAG: hypothetical protein ABGY29_03165 [bacterium]
MARKSQCTFSPGDEPHRCCAKSKTTQQRCKLRVVPGRRVCRFHGGLGGSYPKTGRYSEGLGRFREAYQAARNDPNLMDLRETMALLDVAVQKSVERATAKDTPEFRRRASELFVKARSSGDPQEASRHLSELGELLMAGVADDVALEHLSKAAERLARRQEKAWSIKLDAAQAINARDLVAVLARFADIVLTEAPRDAAARIIRRIDGEVLGSGPAAIGLSSGSEA